MDAYDLVVTGIRYVSGTVADRLSASGTRILLLERARGHSRGSKA